MKKEHRRQAHRLMSLNRIKQIKTLKGRIEAGKDARYIGKFLKEHDEEKGWERIEKEINKTP